MNSIEYGLDFLRQTQARDGSFVGWASRQPDNFTHIQYRPTIFFTALIAQALHTVPTTQSITQSATEALTSQRSPQWTWNYWRRDRRTFYTEPYPDDLDDTACALAAVALHQPQLLDGDVLARVAQTLIQTEDSPGGPYRTWLVGADSADTWQDVDVAVNANIAFLFKQLNITTPGLEDYLIKRIQTNKLTSRYYCGSAPTVYFLARACRPDSQLARHISYNLRQYLKVTTPVRTALECALLLSSAQRLNVSSRMWQSLRMQILSSQATDGGWPAASLYIEPQVDGCPRYAGSRALTTAFALEALYRPSTKQGQVVKKPANSTVKHALKTGQNLQQPLRDTYYSYVRRIAEQDHSGQITQIANRFAQAFGTTLPPNIMTALNQAGLNGWIAYTIYDDFLDEEGKPAELSAGHYATRIMLDNFNQALPGNPKWSRQVQAALTKMDEANTWEITTCRTSAVKNLMVTNLPDYVSYEQLANRSWGHSLVGSAVLQTLGYDTTSAEHRQFEEFFQHFLIARQLHDDAHDWLEDMQRGHLSAVVCLLLRGFDKAEISLDKDLPALQLLFWKQTITQITRLITQQLKLSQQPLDQCRAVKHPQYLQAWLDQLARANTQVAQSKAQAQAFIKTYTKS